MPKRLGTAVSSQPSIRGTIHHQTCVCVCVCVCVSTADLCLLSQQKTTHSGTCLNRPISEPLPWKLKYWMTTCPWVSLPSSLPKPFSLFFLSEAWPSHGWMFAAQGHLDYLVNILSGQGAVTSLPVVVSLANNENISRSGQISRSVMSDSLQPHESQHTRPPCPLPTPGVHSDSRPSSRQCHPAISSSVIPFSSCPHSLPASEPFPMSQRFA